VRTRHLQSVTQGRLATTNSRSGALSPYGPVRAGSTTSQITNEARLTELLNSLENVVANLNYKSFTVYDTLVIATENLRVALSNIATEEGGTDTV